MQQPQGTSSSPTAINEDADLPEVIFEELRNAIQFPTQGIDMHLPQISHTWEAPGLTVEGNFHHMAFRDGQPTMKELIQLLYDRIPYFCLSRSQRKVHEDRFNADKDLRHMSEMLDKAKRLLIRNLNSAPTLGEPGEMFLFLLLEAILKAPRMVCKMSLKTSEEMPVHGADAIHLKYDNKSDTMTVYWGESKLGKKLSDALEDACKSIQAFVTPKDGKTPRDRDIDILCDHIEIADPQERDAILRYCDPYEPAFKNLVEVHSCFVGFDYGAYEAVSSEERHRIEDLFKEEYGKRVKSACELFAKKIRAHELHKLRFHFFLLPFPSVEELRKLYLDKIRGVEE